MTETIMSETKPRTLSLFSAIMILSSVSISHDIVSFSAMSFYMGLGYSVTLIILFSIISFTSLHLSSRMSYNLNAGDYGKLCERAFGKKGEILSNIFVLIALLYSLVSSIYYISDFSSLLLRQFFNKAFYTMHIFLSIFVPAPFVLPLFYFHKIDRLKSITSIIIMSLVTLATGMIIFNSLTQIIQENGARRKNIVADLIELKEFKGHRFIYLNTFSTFFVNYFTLFPLIQKLQSPTPKRRLILNILVSLITAIICLSFPIFGKAYSPKFFCEFFYDRKTPLFITIAKLVIVITQILSLPFLISTATTCINSLLSIIFANNEKFNKSDTFRHVIETIFAILLFVIIVFIRILPTLIKLPYTDLVLDLFSSSVSSILIFTLPAIIFLKLKSKYNTSRLEIAVAYILLILGVVIFILIVGNYINHFVNHRQTESTKMI